MAKKPVEFEEQLQTLPCIIGRLPARRRQVFLLHRVNFLANDLPFPMIRLPFAYFRFPQLQHLTPWRNASMLCLKLMYSAMPR